MALGEARLRSIVESLLMISPEPVPMARLVEVIRIEDPQTEEEAIKTAITGLLGAYGDADRPVARGFRIEEVAGALQLRTVAENAQYVRRFLSAKPQRLSKASLETLAIIAYRQPITRPQIEQIRGVNSDSVIKNLLTKGLVEETGIAEGPGRPVLYATTPEFLQHFGLSALAELPALNLDEVRRQFAGDILKG